MIDTPDSSAWNPRKRVRLPGSVTTKGRLEDHADVARRLRRGAIKAQSQDLHVAAELWRRARIEFVRAQQPEAAAEAAERLARLEELLDAHEGTGLGPREKLLAWNPDVHFRREPRAGGAVVLVSDDDRIVLHPVTWQERTRPAFRNRRTVVTRKGYNVFVDGRLVKDRVELLRDAKRIGIERALPTS